MNNKDFTAYGLRNIGKAVICHKSKPLVYRDFDTGYFEYKQGDTSTFVGFICCQNEQSVIVENENGDQDCIDYDEFKNFFECLHSHQFALAGHQQGKKAVNC